VWVSFKDAKTGKYLADPPRLSANLLDGQNIFLVGRMLCDSEGKPLMQTHGEKIAWAFVWDYFPCSSQQFFLAMGTDFSEVCCVPIPNPEVSLRRMPWVSQVAEVPPFQFVDGYEIHYRPPLERNSDSFPEEEKISLFKNGRDVTSETWAYPIRIAQNEWGMPVGGLMGMALTYQVRFEFGEMPLAEFPDGQKLVFHNLSKPEDGQIIAIDRELKDRDEAVRVSALIGRGAYRLRDGHVVGVRPLSEQEAQTGQFQKDSMDIACFAGSELPSGAKNNDTQVCALKPSLLFKADKGLDYYWISASGEVWDPYIHFYQELVPVEWDAAGKQKPWTLAVSKRREVAFYVKRESRADSELGGNHK
jgi:hypothetical protein